MLILMAGLLSAVLWLSVGFNQKVYSYYTVYFHESTAGLSNDSPIKFNGVQVGFVKEIKLNKNDPRQVEILLSIQEGTPITTSTTATLISQGITGVSYLGLSATSSDLTPLKKMPGEPYPVIPSKPSLFNQLDSMLKDASENIGKVANQAQLVFNAENSKNLTRTLANLERVSAVIDKNSQNIDKSLENTDIILANMSKASKDFPAMLKEIKVGVDKFNELATDLSAAGQNVSATMVSGKTAIDKISQQTIPPAIELINKLSTIAANLEKVSNEMRQNPSVVIRGSSPPKPGPGE